MRRRSSTILVSGPAQALLECFKTYGPQAIDGLIGTAEHVLQTCLSFFLAIINIATSFVVEELEQALASCYGVPAASCKLAANSIKAAMAWLRYKVRCASTGKCMPPWLKQLKDCLDSRLSSPSTAIRTPSKRLRRKTSLEEPRPSSASAETPFAAALQAVGGMSLFSSAGALGLSAGKKDDDVISLASTVPISDIGDIPIVVNPTPREEKSLKKAANQIVQYWDAAAQAMARLHKGQIVHAEMKPGPDGFQIAVWPDGQQASTEQANVLAPVKSAAGKTIVRKKPSVAKVLLKKPSKANVVEQDNNEDSDIEDLEPADFSKAADGFIAMPYPTGAVALRETKGDKRQLWQISHSTKSKEDLKNICIKASHLIASGELSKEDSKAWAKSQL